MTFKQHPDRTAPLLPFAPGDLDRCGVRMNRAEFARFLGVSKQAVGDWTRAGKITLGADGLLDPRQAVQQLLRNTDPARLRSKVLAPLVGEVGALQRRVADLEAALAAARADVEFHEGAAAELIEQVRATIAHFRDDWFELRAMPARAALAAIDAWEADLDAGLLDWNEDSVLDYVSLAELPAVECRADGEEAREGSDPSRLQKIEGGRGLK